MQNENDIQIFPDKENAIEKKISPNDDEAILKNDKTQTAYT